MNACYKNLVFFLAILVGCEFAQAQSSQSAQPAKATSTQTVKPADVAAPAVSGAVTSANKRKAEAIAATIDEDDLTPDILSSKTFYYRCELNDSLTIYTNTDDDEHAAIRWKNKLYRLKRIATTTGANRFENKKAGLVWIGIPTKGMLLNSRLGQQLANECKTTDQ